MIDIQCIYHEEILNTIIQKFEKNFLQATQGTCMKLCNLSLDDMHKLRPMLLEKYPLLHIVILAEIDDPSQEYVSATHLIELRNKEDQALLALIPAGLQTPAEDSYGNATFTDLDISDIDDLILKALYSQMPDSLGEYVKESISMSIPGFNRIREIAFMLTLRENSWNKEAIGLNLDCLGLLPDSTQISNTNEWKRRLVYNRRCASIISDFSVPVPDRIGSLPISADSNQLEIARFLNEANTNDRFELMSAIHQSSDYEKLDFAFWKLPQIENHSLLKITVKELRSKDIQYDGTDKFICIKHGKTSSIKIRIVTDPSPKDFPTLKKFRIKLITTDGHEECKEIKSFKVSESTRNYRDVSIKISENDFEEGTYYFRVVGEDDSGAPLNIEDDFGEEQIQSMWEKEREENGDHAHYQEFKEIHQAKTTNETEDIRIQFDWDDEIVDEDSFPTTRKDKLDNALQAYFRFRIDGLKNGKEQPFPQLSKDSAVWQTTSGLGLQATFLLRLGPNQNYQIPISAKLKDLEREFLEHYSEIGRVDCSLHVNAANAGFPYKLFIPFQEDAVKDLLPLRERVFQSIMSSAPDQSGTFETWFDLGKPETIDLVKKYIVCYKEMLEKLYRDNSTIEVLTELQNLDIINVQTHLENGQIINAKILSPIHPLRLTWFIDLYDLFTSWENKTFGDKRHKKEWSKELIGLFLGDIYPSNNTLILANDSFSYYQYAGELTYGWGIFFETENNKTDVALSSDRQIKTYISELLNLSCDARIDSDVSLELIERYISDYLKQHPYTSKTIINIFNPGDGTSFVKAIIGIEQKLPDKYQYEFRLCCEEGFVTPGEAFRELMNPESNISDKAENFSSVTDNRLFPKLRFSLNHISDFKDRPFDFVSNLSFLINPFSAKCELLPIDRSNPSDTLNGLIVKSKSIVHNEAGTIQWWRTVYCNEGDHTSNDFFYYGNQLLNTIQTITSNIINPKQKNDLFPGTVVSINSNERTLLSLIHDYSDWVVTFDKNIGPDVFDSKNESQNNPYLLDYVPSRELNSISSFLTTKPEIEAYSFLKTYLHKIGLDIICDSNSLLRLIEDIRTISGSLLLQAFSTNNRSFEVIGMALTKRLLEKKGYLKNAFLIPLDLHKDLFALKDQDTKERADLMIVQCDPRNRELHFDVVEIKCRSLLVGEDDLFAKVSEQINHSIEAFKKHFELPKSRIDDRLDRSVKCMELKALLEFYIERAVRFEQLTKSAASHYSEFCKTLEQGYHLSFGKLQIIYNFSAERDYEKIVANDYTRYIIGKSLISDIVSEENRLESFNCEDTLRKMELPLFEMEANCSNSQKNERAVHSNRLVVKPKDLNSSKHVIPTTKSDDLTIPSDETGTKGKEHDSLVDQPSPFSFDTIIGGSSKAVSQAGLLGVQKINNKRIALDLDKTTAISLFGVQGAGKSYTIGTVTEMVLKQINNINQLPSPLAGVIFHYSESMDYAPEFTSMIQPNDKTKEVEILRDLYNAHPDSIKDIVLLTPKDKVEERRMQYPNINVAPILFSSKELDVSSWLFLLGAVGNEALYIKQVKAIMKSIRNNLSFENIQKSIQKSSMPDEKKKLIEDRLSLAREYINDDTSLRDVLRPGRLVIVDLRDEFIEKDDALKLFVVMLNIFSSVKSINEQHFNKFIVFDEAHKYMDNKELSSTIATAIKEMRHKGVSIMIASQDPTGLPPEIIELSSILIMHRFNSPAWLKHIQKAITQTAVLTPADLASLNIGEAYIWSNESSDPQFSSRPIKVKTRPRVTKHGGATISAINGSGETINNNKV